MLLTISCVNDDVITYQTSIDDRDAYNRAFHFLAENDHEGSVISLTLQVSPDQEMTFYELEVYHEFGRSLHISSAT